MANYLKKLSRKLVSRIKPETLVIWLSLVSFITLSGILVVNLTVKNLLTKAVPPALEQIRNGLDYQMQLAAVDFNLMGGFRLRDLTLSDGQGDILKIKNAQINISVFSLINKEFKITNIVFSQAEIPLSILTNSEELLHNLSLASKSLLGLGEFQDFSINSNKIRVKVKDLKVVFDKYGLKNSFLILNANSFFKAKSLIVSGRVDVSNLRMETEKIDLSFLDNTFTPTVSFYVKALPYAENLLIDDLKVVIADIKLIGSGVIYNTLKDPYVDVKIISNPLNLSDKFRAKSQYYLDGLLNLSTKLSGSIKSPKLDTEITLLNSRLYFLKNILRIGNISCNLVLAKEGMNIKDFSAVIDDRFPFSLSGKINNFFDPEFNLSITSTFRGMASAASIDDLDMHLILSLVKTKPSLDSSLILSLIKEDKDHKKYCFRQFESKLSDIKLELGQGDSGQADDSRSLMIAANKLDIIEKAISNNYATLKETFEFSDFKLGLEVDPGFWKLKHLSCRGYNGQIKAFGSCDFTNTPYLYNLVLGLNNIDILKLKRFYPIECNLFGSINGRLVFQNKTKDYIVGDIDISAAALEGLEPLNETADYLGISSIKKIEQAKIESDFRFSPNEIRIEKFNLDAPGIILNSKFDINKNKWLSADISLSLARRFLEESKQFRTLIGLIKEKAEMIDFDFKIGGFPGNLRIQLLEGAFREKLINKLSKDIQNLIEQEINKITESLKSHPQQLPK